MNMFVSVYCSFEVFVQVLVAQPCRFIFKHSNIQICYLLGSYVFVFVCVVLKPWLKDE